MNLSIFQVRFFYFYFFGIFHLEPWKVFIVGRNSSARRSIFMIITVMLIVF